MRLRKQFRDLKRERNNDKKQKEIKTIYMIVKLVRDKMW